MEQEKEQKYKEMTAHLDEAQQEDLKIRTKVFK